MEKKAIVIYHGDCSDGLAAAWCFWKEFKDNIEYHKGHYGKPVPDIVDRTVYLVDFSYKADVMGMILDYAKSVVLLDHHSSALDDLWHLAKHPNMDMSHCTLEHSGAIIAWNYVKQLTCHKRKMPTVLGHVEDRDLWKFALPHTREIMTAIFSYPLTFEQFDKFTKLTKVGIKDLIKEGQILERKHFMDLEKILSLSTRIVDIGGHQIPVANVPYMFASDAGNVLCKGYPFAATYYDSDTDRVFSLRSHPEGADVSKIALQYGGGGHKNASGFKVKRDHILAKI